MIFYFFNKIHQLLLEINEYNFFFG